MRPRMMAYSVRYHAFCTYNVMQPVRNLHKVSVISLLFVISRRSQTVLNDALFKWFLYPGSIDYMTCHGHLVPDEEKSPSFAYF